MLQHQDQRVHHFAQIVRWYVCCHPNRDARRSVNQHIWNRRWQHHGLFQGPIEIARECHRIHVQLAQHLHGCVGQTRFGIAHRRWRISIDATEVPLPIHQHVAHRKVLCHARHCLVYSSVTMRVILTQHLTNDSSRFLVGRIRPDAHVVHRVENAPLHRFHPISCVWQRPRNDYTHRVIQIRRLHLFVDVDDPVFLTRHSHLPSSSRMTFHAQVSRRGTACHAQIFRRDNNL